MTESKGGAYLDGRVYTRRIKRENTSRKSVIKETERYQSRAKDICRVLPFDLRFVVADTSSPTSYVMATVVASLATYSNYKDRKFEVRHLLFESDRSLMMS